MDEQIAELIIGDCTIYPEKYLPNDLGLVGHTVFKELIRFSKENARLREALIFRGYDPDSELKYHEAERQLEAILNETNT